ncbi:MAG: hypothetical protein KAJ55_00405 [Anaerolineales bacterium]|nr:hypothetical protein [Anaerolineales bacterium]
MDRFEVMHQLGYAPLLVVVLVIVGAQKLVSAKILAPAMVLVALAFFVSYPWDSVVNALPKEDQFKPSYFFLPVQIWLVILAFLPKSADRLFSAGVLVLLAFISADLSWPGPDFLLTLVGSVAILSVARGWLAIPLWVYFFFGTLAYFSLAFGANPLPAWYAYQACRALAFIVFIGLILPPLSQNGGRSQWWNPSRRS